MVSPTGGPGFTPQSEPTGRSQNKLSAFFSKLFPSFTGKSSASNAKIEAQPAQSNNISDPSNKANQAALNALNFKNASQVSSQKPSLESTEQMVALKDKPFPNLDLAPVSQLPENLTQQLNAETIMLSTPHRGGHAVETFAEKLEISGVPLTIMGITENNSSRKSELPSQLIKAFEKELKNSATFGKGFDENMQEGSIKDAAESTLKAYDSAMKAAGRSGTSLNFSIVVPRQGGAQVINIAIGQNTACIAANRHQSLSIQGDPGLLGKEGSLKVSSFFAPTGTVLIHTNINAQAKMETLEDQVRSSLINNENPMEDAPEADKVKATPNAQWDLSNMTKDIFRWAQPQNPSKNGQCVTSHEVRVW